MGKLELIIKSISIVADIMTIVGVAGVSTWTLFTKDRGPFHDKVTQILAYCLKSAFCLILLVVMLGTSKLALDFFVVLVNGHNSVNTKYWSASEPLGFIVGYLFLLLVMLPIFLLISASVYSWSLQPFRRLISAIRHQPTQTRP